MTHAGLSLQDITDLQTQPRKLKKDLSPYWMQRPFEKYE